MDSTSDMIEAARELRKLLGTHIEGIRHQLKIAGGKEEEINIDILREIFVRYGTSPYHACLLSELL